jgi:ribosomal protein S12 methylthiotransferase
MRDWVQEMKFDRLGCFTYSHEENTDAYKLVDNVPEDVKQQRANEIMEIASTNIVGIKPRKNWQNLSNV